jgi:hypothetical protein
MLFAVGCAPRRQPSLLAEWLAHELSVLAILVDACEMRWHQPGFGYLRPQSP